MPEITRAKLLHQGQFTRLIKITQATSCYANHGEAHVEIADYIVGFYNPIRLHSTLGYQSPNSCELQQAQSIR